jgi:hypothetical protein
MFERTAKTRMVISQDRRRERFTNPANIATVI